MDYSFTSRALGILGICCLAGYASTSDCELDYLLNYGSDTRQFTISNTNGTVYSFIYRFSQASLFKQLFDDLDAEKSPCGAIPSADSFGNTHTVIDKTCNIGIEYAINPGMRLCTKASEPISLLLLDCLKEKILGPCNKLEEDDRRVIMIVGVAVVNGV